MWNGLARRFSPTLSERMMELDLRYLREVQMSDAWDGEMTCSDGMTLRVILYQDKVVWSQRVIKTDGQTQVRTPRITDGFWISVMCLARIYFQSAKIANKKFTDPKGSAKEKEGWDIVWMSEENHNLLISHPTWMQCSEGVTFTEVNKERYRVVCGSV